MFSLKKIFGKDDTFFDLLEESAREAEASAQFLARFFSSPGAPKNIEELTRFRRKDKKIKKDIAEQLAKTFVTVIEKEDIEALSSAIYKVPKTVEKFAERYLASAAQLKDHDFSRHTSMLAQAANHVSTMVNSLRRGRQLEEIKEMNGRLQQVEGDADKLMLEILKDLYSGRHAPLQVMLLKDLHEMLERGVDKCRNAGSVVTHIAMKNS
jgi:uncharacterized protein Yka (UPF0111/DUF47 family)